jgi:hypothetical protein
MKNLLILLFILATNHSFAQSGVMPYVHGKIHFTDLITVDSSSKESLSKKAVIWFEKATNDYNNNISNKASFGLKDNIILKDIDNGEFVGTLNMLVPQAFNESLVSFDVYIYTKDGKYRYDFTDFKYLGNSLTNKIAGKNMNSVTTLESIDNKKYKRLMTLIYKSCKSAIENLNEQMARPSIVAF